MLNKMMVIGHVGADPEMRYSAQGVAVTHFRLASNRKHRDKDTGFTEEETTWFSCVAFQQQAETAATYLHTGSLVYVEGRMASHRYTNRQQVEVTGWELLVEQLELLEKRPAEAASPTEEQPAEPEPAVPAEPGGHRRGRRAH